MAYSKLYIGRNHPNWKGGLIQRICLECGRIFYTKPSEVKKGHGKYCSRKCSVKVQRHNTLSKKTKPELIFEEICKRNDLPFHYVGDGSLWIGDANPDFIHNTRKIVVEVYGDYWHSPLLNGNIQYNHTLEGRRKQLKAEGHKLIVFWESDLKRKDAEAFVLYELTKQGIL
jgi:G:T-mismatch repair DNA endonuclease (very short patch repair protein)